MALVAIRYDLRVPPFAGTTHEELYRACLEQCAWADEKGFDAVALSEHHGVVDGYLPAPLVLAAAIAGRTRRIPINIAAVLVPLHDPVRLAEQLAVLDLTSGSRVSLVAGLGYRAEEFEMAGIDRKRRGTLLEEAVAVLRKAWTGEPFEWRGRTIRVTPKPAVPPMILIGGSTEKAALRAARLGCGFFPAIGDERLADVYRDECSRIGFDGGFVSMPAGPGFVHVTDDPERDWRVIGPHALYDAETYHSWQPAGQRSQVEVAARSIEELRKSGVYCVVTPEECIELARRDDRVLLHPLMGGLSPDFAWKSLELFAEKVLPHIRAAAG